jgi:hypothetical protein
MPEIAIDAFSAWLLQIYHDAGRRQTKGPILTTRCKPHGGFAADDTKTEWGDCAGEARDDMSASAPGCRHQREDVGIPVADKAVAEAGKYPASRGTRSSAAPEKRQAGARILMTVPSLARRQR